MQFHINHNASIQLKGNKRTATITDTAVRSEAVCFGNQIVEIDEKVVLKVVDGNKYDEVTLGVGFTSDDPSTFDHESCKQFRKLLKNSNVKVRFIEKQHTSKEQTQTGDFLVFWKISASGECTYGFNDEEKGTLFKMSVKKPLFPVICVFRPITTVQFAELVRIPTDGYEFQTYKDMLIPVPAGWKWKVKTIEQVFNTLKEINEKSQATNVEHDNEALCRMVLAAKSSNWDSCFAILKQLPHIINGIPQERAWSVLHQAAFRNDEYAIKKLLEYKNCDLNIKAKQDWSKVGEPGFTPLQIAEKNNCTTAITLLKNGCSSTTAVEASFISSEEGKDYLLKGIPYFMLAVAFMKKDIVHRLDIKHIKSFLQVSENVYGIMKDEIEYIKDATAETLYPFNSTLREDCRNKSSPEEFFSEIICIYTKSYIYKQLNLALRRASLKLDPTGDDLLLCMYSLFLQSILLHWEALVKFTGISYRGMVLNDKEIALYTKGTAFLWMNFTSSLKLRRLAEDFVRYKGRKEENIIFIINNKNESEWSPREIKDHSANTYNNDKSDDFGVNELVHPAAAMFMVTGVNKKGDFTEISIELQKPLIK